MGGEEFALLMPDTPLADAQAACERMRVGLARHDWSGMARGLIVTGSFGVATSEHQGTGADLLRAADTLLYQAKREGRNRVVAEPATIMSAASDV
jgi:diguanylate cyclase (GGDEF)-like protein